MAGHPGNHHRPTAGPLKGQSVYLSKAQQGGLTRAQVHTRLNAGDRALIAAANTQKPAGMAKPRQTSVTPGVLSATQSAQSRKDSQKNRGKIKAMAMDMIDVFTQNAFTTTTQAQSGPLFGSFAIQGAQKHGKFYYGGPKWKSRIADVIDDRGNGFRIKVDLNPDGSYKKTTVTMLSTKAIASLIREARTAGTPIPSAYIQAAGGSTASHLSSLANQ